MKWAVSINERDAGTLGSLRLHPGILVGVRDGVIWVRGETLDESVEIELRKLPSIERYEVVDHDRLRPLHSRIVMGRLPLFEARPLRDWLQLDMPAPAYAGLVTGKSVLSLMRTSEEQEPGILVTGMDEWGDYVVNAPMIRLRHLMFAVNEEGMVLVRGKPLPPLRGARYVDHGGLAVPVGFHWSPPVDVGVVKEAFGISDKAVVLWREDGSLAEIAGEQLLPVTRSAVRLTWEAFTA